MDAMHWWVTKKALKVRQQLRMLKTVELWSCLWDVYGDPEQPLPQGLLIFRKWKDPGDEVDPASDETCPHGLLGWTIIFHNSHSHSQNKA